MFFFWNIREHRSNFGHEDRGREPRRNIEAKPLFQPWELRICTRNERRKSKPYLLELRKSLLTVEIFVLLKGKLEGKMRKKPRGEEKRASCMKSGGGGLKGFYQLHELL